MNFIYVKYGRYPYPDGIRPDLVEVAGHFDKEYIPDIPNYSLHTEYSFGKRNMTSELISSFPEILSANKNGIPQLWKSKLWAEEFAGFIIALTEGHNAPSVIEVHPPFNDYCDMKEFIDRYDVFEKKIHQVYPRVPIVVENRAGSYYRGGKFILSKAEDIAELCKLIIAESSNLGIVLDFPQLLTGEDIYPGRFDADKYNRAIDTIYPYQGHIKGIHIWGKKEGQNGRWESHVGTLNDLFPDENEKKVFLDGIRDICDDDEPRFLVPEVNSGGADLASVVRDLVTI